VTVHILQHASLIAGTMLVSPRTFIIIGLLRPGLFPTELAKQGKLLYLPLLCSPTRAPIGPHCGLIDTSRLSHRAWPLESTSASQKSPPDGEREHASNDGSKNDSYALRR
jgi:hypothetical protein